MTALIILASDMYCLGKDFSSFHHLLGNTSTETTFLCCDPNPKIPQTDYKYGPPWNQTILPAPSTQFWLATKKPKSELINWFLLHRADARRLLVVYLGHGDKEAITFGTKAQLQTECELRYDELKTYIDMITAPFTFVNQACKSGGGLDLIRGSLPKGHLAWASAGKYSWPVTVSPTSGLPHGGELSTSIIRDIGEHRLVNQHIQIVKGEVRKTTAQVEVDNALLLAPAIEAYNQVGYINFNESSELITVTQPDTVKKKVVSWISGKLDSLGLVCQVSRTSPPPILPYRPADRPHQGDETTNALNINTALAKDKTSLPDYSFMDVNDVPTSVPIETPVATVIADPTPNPPVQPTKYPAGFEAKNLFLWTNMTPSMNFNPFNWLKVNENSVHAPTEDAELFSLWYRIRIGKASEKEVNMWNRTIDWREGIFDRVRRWGKDIGLRIDVDRERVCEENGEVRDEVEDTMMQIKKHGEISAVYADGNDILSGSGAPYIYPIAWIAAAFSMTPGKKVQDVDPESWAALRDILRR